MIQQIDDAVLHFFGNLQNPVLNPIMIFLSAITNNGEMWIAVGLIMLLFKRTRKAGATVLIALLFSLLIGNMTLKPLIARMRPFERHELELLVSPPHSFSFPSGHTMSSFAAAISILIHNKKLGIIAVTVASLIAISRMYLQVHYLTDVLAGVVFGILYAIAAALIVEGSIRLYKKFKS